jgi:hypothetical protein
MADIKEKEPDIEVTESQDGSATVDLPEDMLNAADQDDGDSGSQSNAGGQDDDADHPGDDDELRAAKRNRRRAKKDLIRKTNQEKDVRLQQLQRENEEFKRRLSQLERNTKAEHVTRLEKNIEDAQVQLEYAKMKIAEATQNQDGQAMVEAQTLLANAQDQIKTLSYQKDQAHADMQRPQQPVVDPNATRFAQRWMKRNSWFTQNGNDPDSRVAKKVDELLAAQGWNPADPDYWEELDSRLQRELPHRYNDSNDDDNRGVRRPRNVVGSSGREASAAYGGVNRNQFLLSPDRVKAMKEAGAWDNPERKKRMIEGYIAYDRANPNRR